MQKLIYNFQDDLTVILENPKIQVFPKILRKGKHFKIYDLQTCLVMITGYIIHYTCITWILFIVINGVLHVQGGKY